MTGIKCPVLLVVVTCLWMSGRGDTDLSCVFMERCILPCSFQAGAEVVIHWIQTGNDYPVHSYYHSQDQLGHQNQRFRGRTSLFKDEISRGNASLQLTGVEVQDEGRYKCYTSTISGNKESYINLNVDALVRKVDIEQVGNRIHCSSEGIYPEPDLTWSTRPPSTVTFENTTTVQQTEQRLYSISSSLIVSESVTGLDYICTVSTHTNRRTATVFKRSPISTADSETTIQCTSTNSPLTGLVWRFNHSQTILTRTGPDGLVNVSEGWEHHVKSVSKSGSLTLQKLSSNHEGVYTCELSGAEQTTVTSTFLRIDTETSHNPEAIVGGVIGFVVLVLVVVCLLYWYFKRQKGNTKRKPTNEPEELTDLNVGNGAP